KKVADPDTTDDVEQATLVKSPTVRGKKRKEESEPTSPVLLWGLIGGGVGLLLLVGGIIALIAILGPGKGSSSSEPVVQGGSSSSAPEDDLQQIQGVWVGTTGETGGAKVEDLATAMRTAHG